MKAQSHGTERRSRGFEVFTAAEAAKELILL